jgi:hypothetical protein
MAARITQFRRTLTEQYDMISWIVRVFFGGAVSIFFLSVLSSFISYYVPLVNNVYQTDNLFTPQLFPTFILLLGTYLISPLVLCFCLTKREPYLKLVPPLYISIISVSWMVIYWLASNLSLLLIVAFSGMFMMYVGLFEDMAARSILGIATVRELVYFEHLRIYADVEVVRARISDLAIMTTLELSERSEGDAEQGYRFNTQRRYDIKKVISLRRDRSYPDSTDLKVVYFERARYNLRFSPAFFERINEFSEYLHSIFLKREPILPCEIVIPLTNTALDPLVDSVEDDLHGYYARYRRLPARDSVKILGLLAIAGLTVGLFLSKQPDIYWQLSLLLDILIYLMEIPELLRRRT